MSIFNFMAAGVNALAEQAQNAKDRKQAQQQFEAEMNLANEQFDWNKKVAENNFALQQSQFDYQKELNQLQMEREDSSYSRAVQDLKNAGLSPLMLSSGSSANPLNAGSAPQMDTNGVNTAYGSKQDAYRRLQEQRNYERQMRFNQWQARKQMLLQTAGLAQEVASSVMDNKLKAEQIERARYENDWYAEHGYHQITLATVLSDFLNREDIKKAIDNISNWTAPKIQELTEVVPKVLDETKDGFTKEGMSETLQRKSGLSKQEADEYVNLVEKELDEPWYKASWKKIKTTAIIVKDAISEKYNRRYK